MGWLRFWLSKSEAVLRLLLHVKEDCTLSVAIEHLHVQYDSPKVLNLVRGLILLAINSGQFP